jgi:tetratricopeptide (TPR) repeat protein
VEKMKAKFFAIVLIFLTAVIAFGGTSFAAVDSQKAQQYLNYGSKYFHGKQYDYAIKYYEASISINPTYQAYQYLGTAYYYKGNKDKAIEAFNKSIELNPDNPAVKGALARLGAGGAATGPGISNHQMAVHPVLLAAIFVGAIAALFVF